MKLATDNLDQEQACEAQKATNTVSSVELVTPDPMTGFEQVLLVICNFSSDSDTLWISDQEKDKSLSLKEGQFIFFEPLHDKEVKELLQAMAASE